MKQSIIKFAISAVLFAIAFEAVAFILAGKSIPEWQGLAVGILVAGGIFFTSGVKVEKEVHFIQEAAEEPEEESEDSPEEA